MPRRVVSGTRLPAVLVHDADHIAWIGAANSAAARATPARPRAPAPLSTEQALELAVLGIVMARPLSPDRVADLVRRIMAPPVQPTLDVVEGRLQDLARRGLVVITAREPGCALVRRSAAGVRYARALLQLPGPWPGAAHRDLVFILKVCMLDVLAAADRSKAIDELRRDLQSALDSAEQAARHCRSTSIYAHQWLERQASRLRDDLRWLTGLTTADGG